MSEKSDEKQRMAGSEEFRNALEKRKGTEWYDAASEVGDLHDPHMSSDGVTERYSGAEIRAELRHGRGDKTVDDMISHYEKEYASGNINLNGNAKDFLRDRHGATLVRDGEGGGDDKPKPPKEDDPPVTVDPIDEGPGPSNPGGPDQEIGYPGRPGYGTGDQIQNVNQDNDINSTVTGDNNTVTNNQDNSIKQYGAWGSKTANRAKELRDRYVADVSRFARIG